MGDSAAFEQIFARYERQLYRYCRGILSHHEDAQDALQATMANALRSLPGESRQIALTPWLYRVAHNESISILRRRRTSSADVAELELAPGADVEAETRERLRQLVTDLDSLPDRQRGALTMRELSGMSYGQVAQALELSPAAARQAVYEARTALAELGEGREMECEEARRSISARDGRVLRGRKLRAHIRSCDGCRGFEASIAQRRNDFQILSPVLPGVAGAGILAGLIGGEAGRTLATSGTAKVLATLSAAAVIGTGAAGFSGAIHLPGLGGGKDKPALEPASAPAGAGGQAKSDAPAASSGRHAGQARRPAGSAIRASPRVALMVMAPRPPARIRPTARAPSASAAAPSAAAASSSAANSQSGTHVSNAGGAGDQTPAGLRSRSSVHLEREASVRLERWRLGLPGGRRQLQRGRQLRRQLPGLRLPLGNPIRRPRNTRTLRFTTAPRKKPQ